MNSFSHGIQDEAKKNRSIKRTIRKLLQKADKTCPPIDFKLYTVKDLLIYLLSLCTKKDTRLSSASYNGKHSRYFTCVECMDSNRMRNLLDRLRYYPKIKKSIAKEKQDCEGKIQTDKIPISYLLYYCINKYMLHDNTLESAFACAFLTTAWNLIYRATNT